MALNPVWCSSRQIAANQTDGSDGNASRAVFQVPQPVTGFEKAGKEDRLNPKERTRNNERCAAGQDGMDLSFDALVRFSSCPRKTSVP